MYAIRSYYGVLQSRQGLQVACLEEIAYRMGFIDAERVMALVRGLGKTGYAEYLTAILKEAIPQ